MMSRTLTPDEGPPMAKRVQALVPLDKLTPEHNGSTVTINLDGRDYEGPITAMAVVAGHWLVYLDVPDDVVVPGEEPVPDITTGPIAGAAPHEEIGNGVRPEPEQRSVALGPLLSIVKRTLLCQPADLRDVLVWLTGRELDWDDLPDALRTCQPYIADAFPDLVALPDPPNYEAPGRNTATVVRLYGAYIDGLRAALRDGPARIVTAPPGPLTTVPEPQAAQ